MFRGYLPSIGRSVLHNAVIREIELGAGGLRDLHHALALEGEGAPVHRAAGVHDGVRDGRGM